MSPDELNRWLLTPTRRPLVMGVLNVTPDSFSDGGKFHAVEAAREQAEAMVAAGADLIDIGGESTRPGSSRVPADEQVRRVVPVLRACGSLQTTFSVDTSLTAVARAAFDAGATVLNDISAGRDDPETIAWVARTACPVILMHMAGTPSTMQDAPRYTDVVAEVQSFLWRRARLFEAAGVAAGRVVLDPGIGFGKTTAHNLALLGALPRLTALPYPMLVGVSRKGFIGKITHAPAAADRVMGTAAAVAYAIDHGAAIVRVHDIAAMRQVVDMSVALRDARRAEG